MKVEIRLSLPDLNHQEYSNLLKTEIYDDGGCHLEFRKSSVAFELLNPDQLFLRILIVVIKQQILM